RAKAPPLNLTAALARTTGVFTQIGNTRAIMKLMKKAISRADCLARLAHSLRQTPVKRAVEADLIFLRIDAFTASTGWLQSAASSKPRLFAIILIDFGSKVRAGDS